MEHIGTSRRLIFAIGDHGHEALRELRCIRAGGARMNGHYLEAAQNTIFKGLAASGWHTAALRRLLVESELKRAGAIVGAGFDKFRWPRPVRSGDELHIESEVLEVRASRSLPN
jgi:hypothetical protein